MNERLLIALNRHDLDAFVACFADGYRSDSPRIQTVRSSGLRRCETTGSGCLPVCLTSPLNC